MIGGEAPCMHCGCGRIGASDSMLCDSCEVDFGDSQDDRYGYCDYCDRRMVVDDAHYIPSAGHLVCDWCYDQHTSNCVICGELNYTMNLTYDKNVHGYCCEYCVGPRYKEE